RKRTKNKQGQLQVSSVRAIFLLCGQSKDRPKELPSYNDNRDPYPASFKRCGSNMRRYKGKQKRENYQDMLTAHRLRKVLNYNPATGQFRWRVTISSRALAGSVAGTRGRRGHIQIRIDGKLYQSSRLAWLYKTGRWPKLEIDFINRNRSDTRWANLREVTPSQIRRKTRRHRKLGARGVSRAR